MDTRPSADPATALTVAEALSDLRAGYPVSRPGWACGVGYTAEATQLSCAVPRVSRARGSPSSSDSSRDPEEPNIMVSGLSEPSADTLMRLDVAMGTMTTESRPT